MWNGIDTQALSPRNKKAAGFYYEKTQNTSVVSLLWKEMLRSTIFN